MLVKSLLFHYQRKPKSRFSAATSLSAPLRSVRHLLLSLRPKCRDRDCDSDIPTVSVGVRWMGVARNWSLCRGVPVLSRFHDIAPQAPDPEHTYVKDPQRRHGTSRSEWARGRSIRDERSHHRTVLLLPPQHGLAMEAIG